jgi:hypothetical protein
MHTGLNAVSWSMKWMSLALGGLVLTACLAYIGLVFVIIVVQGVGALSQ